MFGLPLLAVHAWDKYNLFSIKVHEFPDPLGVGANTSLTLAIVLEGLGALLVIAGAFTRVGALLAAAAMFTAFASVHHFALQGTGNGELAFLYLAGFLVILFAGAGRFSVDGWLLKKNKL